MTAENRIGQQVTFDAKVRVSMLPVTVEDLERWHSEQFRDRIYGYLEDSPEQPFFNRTDIMRATGRADNFSDRRTQVTIRAICDKYGGTQGGEKVKHIRLTREGFIEACRVIGPPVVSNAHNGKMGALSRYAGISRQDSFVQNKKHETFGRRKVKEAVLPRAQPENLVSEKAEDDEQNNLIAEFVSQIDHFIEENRKVAYSMSDIMRATGRGKKPYPKIKRTIRQMLSDDGITAIVHPEIPEETFRRISVAVGPPLPKLSEGMRRSWQIRGVKQQVGLSDEARRTLEVRRGKRSIDSSQNGTYHPVEADEIQETIKNMLEEKQIELPQEYLSQIIGFFNNNRREYYLLADIAQATGRSVHSANSDRTRIREIAYANGITREWKTAPLLIPLKLAAEICLELGPKFPEADNRVTVRQARQRRTFVQEPFRENPQEQVLATGIVESRQPHTLEVDTFISEEEPRNSEFDRQDAFGLGVLMRGKTHVFESFGVRFNDRDRTRISRIVDPIIFERRSMGIKAPDLEEEIVPSLKQKLLAFATGDRNTILAQSNTEIRSLLTYLMPLQSTSIQSLVNSL